MEVGPHMLSRVTLGLLVKKKNTTKTGGRPFLTTGRALKQPMLLKRDRLTVRFLSPLGLNAERL